MKKAVNCLVIMSCFTLGATVAYAGADAHHGKMHGTHASHHGEKHGKRHGKMFHAMDADGDGAVTKVEFDAYHDMKFKKMDVNGDGEITLGDVKFKHKFKKADVGPNNYYKVGR